MRLCSKHRCPALVQPPVRYCQTHIRQTQQDRAEADRQYNQQRDRRFTEFYHSREWLAVRVQVLDRDRWLCQMCKAERRITKANTVHHRTALRDAWELRLEVDNLESVCPPCHSALERRRRAPSQG